MKKLMIFLSICFLSQFLLAADSTEYGLHMEGAKVFRLNLGGVVPTNLVAQGIKPGDIIVDTYDDKVYVIYIANPFGSVTLSTNGVSSLPLVDGTLAVGDLAVASNKVIIGNGSGVGSAQSVSGDVVIATNGVTAISGLVIVNADVATNAAIAINKLASGVGTNTIAQTVTLKSFVSNVVNQTTTIAAVTNIDEEYVTIPPVVTGLTVTALATAGIYTNYMIQTTTVVEYMTNASLSLQFDAEGTNVTNAILTCYKAAGFVPVTNGLGQTVTYVGGVTNVAAQMFAGIAGLVTNAGFTTVQYVGITTNPVPQTDAGIAGLVSNVLDETN